MKFAGRVALAVLALITLPLCALWIAGAALPREHTVRVTRAVAAPPERAWTAITDVEHASAWRHLDRVELLSRAPLRWREHGEDGELAFIEDAAAREEGRRFVARIDDTEERAFGGSWTYLVEAEGEGARVTIIEEGWIEPAIFRTLARWVWGHEASARAYLDALEAHLSE
ncbi:MULTISPECIES: SRPBCC family protein [Sandaracinus]|uniref:SRPBCC family protein n=1 Tax=Sandaracinus TaxID=1055688 RepID=UPI0019D47F52|nr:MULTISPECIES: SRPBCC family protein [Sandaracinus]QRN75839.1 Hypothetical protein MSR10575_89260 [Sandaracinus sp.]UJR87379.1 Hypothetical protein I5071_1710 [Sandaracinus amylolyticus]